EFPERVVRQPARPRDRPAEPSEPDRRIQFRPADLDVERAGLPQPLKVRRGGPGHRLAAGDDGGDGGADKITKSTGFDHVELVSAARASVTTCTYVRARSVIRSNARVLTSIGSTNWPPTPRQAAPAFR